MIHSVGRRCWRRRRFSNVYKRVQDLGLGLARVWVLRLRVRAESEIVASQKADDGPCDEDGMVFVYEVSSSTTTIRVERSHQGLPFCPLPAGGRGYNNLPSCAHSLST